MKIVKILGNSPSLKEVKEIYEKGNKIALSFLEDTALGEECSIFPPEGKEGYKAGTLKDEFYFGERKMLYAKKNTPIVIEKIVEGKLCDLAYVNPYGDEAELEFLLFDDLLNGTYVMSDMVYEVEL